jgi:hypothetical protein
LLQSFLQLLKGQRLDRIVWTADISYWIAGRQAVGQAKSAWDTEEGYLKLCRELGILPYYWYANFWLGEPEFEKVDLLSGSQGHTQFHLWKTPVGELRQESVFLTESCSEAITKHPVETIDDLKVLLYILAHRRLKPTNLDTYHQRMALWARYDGLPAIALPRSPLPAFFYEWAGLQNAVYLMLDYPELVNEALHQMERQESPVLDAVCQVAVPLVHFADNLSSENLSGLFDDHMRERYRRRLDRLHAAGIRCAVHLDGTVKGLLPKLAGVGMDAVEALTPRPVGDVDVAEMRSVAADDKVILWGGVPGAMFAPPFTWTDMKMHVEKLIEVWQGTPFVVGVADQVPPNGDIEMVKKISELLSRRG